MLRQIGASRPEQISFNCLLCAY